MLDQKSPILKELWSALYMNNWTFLDRSLLFLLCHIDLSVSRELDMFRMACLVISRRLSVERLCSVV